MSAGRTRRPWLGAEEPEPHARRTDLRPGLLSVSRATSGRTANVNPDYDETYVFTNDFAALRPDTSIESFDDGLLRAEGERGIVPGRLLLASPRPDARPDGGRRRPARRRRLGGADRRARRRYRWVQVFENRGEAMGASNPHPHGQIWAGRRCPATAPARTRRSARTWRRPAGGCCSTTSTRSRAASGSSSRPTSGSPSSRSGRPGRSRRCSSRSGRRRG